MQNLSGELPCRFRKKTKQHRAPQVHHVKNVHLLRKSRAVPVSGPDSLTSEASAESLPLRLFRLLPGGTTNLPGRDFHPLEHDTFSRRTGGSGFSLESKPAFRSAIPSMSIRGEPQKSHATARARRARDGVEGVRPCRARAGWTGASSSAMSCGRFSMLSISRSSARRGWREPCSQLCRGIR
jgi:hypothetical protein